MTAVDFIHTLGHARLAILLLIQDTALHEVADRLRCHHIINTVPAAPILWLSAKEGAHRTQITLMPQEVRLLLALGPEADSV